MSFISEVPDDKSIYRIREFIVTPPLSLPNPVLLCPPFLIRGEEECYDGILNPAVLAVSRILL